MTEPSEPTTLREPLRRALELLGQGERTRQLEDAVAKLAEKSLSGHDAMLLDETESLLRMGAERYTLFHDAQGAAAAYALRDGEGERARIQHLRDRFEGLLKAAIPEVVVFGAASPRLVGTSNFALPGITSEVALIALDLDGVMLSAGSSCSSGKVATSHVLGAMGVAYAQASCALRLSLGWDTEMADIEAVIASLTKLWQRKTASQASVNGVAA